MEWTRAEGTLYRWNTPRPLSDLTDYLEKHRILASVDCGDEDIIQIRFLVDDDERVATSKRSALRPGLDLQDLVADIAHTFGVDALVEDYTVVGEESADEGEPDEPDDLRERALAALDSHPHDEGGAQGDGIRAVTVLTGGVPEVARLARKLDEPIMVLPCESLSVVLTEEGDSFPNNLYWAQIPTVQVFSAAGHPTMIAEAEGATVAVSWGGQRLTTPSGLSGAAAEALAELSGDADVATLVAAVGGDPAEIEKALHPESGSVTDLLAALGVPSDVREFLEGDRAAHDVPNVVVVTPPTTGETLRYLVDEAFPEGGIVEVISDYENDHPVMARVPAVAGGVVGGALIAYGILRASEWRKVIALVGGGALIVNALAELSAFEMLKRARREGRPQANW